MTETSGVIHFSISGEYITDIVRQFILEDKWETATALLLEDIHGMDYNTAVNIMTGKARLVGKDSGIDLEMIEDHEYSRNLQYHYGARYHDRLNNIWYEPYAVVTSFGDRDHSWSMKEYGTGSSKEKRAMFYADNRSSDMAVMISLDGVNHSYDTSDVIVLFKRTHSAPLWMKNKNQSPEEAFISAINVGLLIDKRGKFQLASDDAPLHVFGQPSGRAGMDKLDSSFYPEVSPLAQMLQETSGLSSDVVQGVLGEKDWTSRPMEDKEFASDSGYILPDGKFYGCGYMEHASLACRILKHIINIDVGSIKDYEKEADQRHWLRIQKSALTSGTNFGYTGRKLTKKQTLSLVDWCNTHHEKFPTELV